MRKCWLTILLTVVMMFTFTAVNVFAADSIRFVPVVPISEGGNEYDVQINGEGPVVTIYCLQQKDIWPGGDVNYVSHENADDSFELENVDLLTPEEIEILKKIVYAGYPNDALGIFRNSPYAEWCDEEEMKDYAGQMTNTAIWTMMTEWGKAGSNPNQTLADAPDEALALIDFATTDTTVKKPSSDRIIIEGSGHLAKEGNKWSTGELKITQPSGYNLRFELDLPDGATAVNEYGDTITSINENEPFRIISSDATALQNTKLTASGTASYPTHINFFVTKDATGRIDQTTGEPQTYQTMLYVEKETMDLSGELNLTADEVGNLLVSKTVTGDVPDEDAGKTFEFKVTLDNTGINGTYGEMTFENGVAVFTLKDGDTILAQDLPADIGYAVEETPCDNYVTSKSHETGTIAKGTTAQVSFYNEYKAAPASPVDVTLSGTKILTDKALENEMFSFTLKGEDDGISETVKNDANGNIEFSTITYNTPGVYHYEVEEEQTAVPGVTIDTTIYDVVVTVTEPTDGGTDLVASVEVDDRKGTTGLTGSSLNFENKYVANSTSVVLGGTKFFENFPEDLDVNSEFTFALYEKDTEDPVDRKTINMNGVVEEDYEFDAITYTEEGTHNYTIKETKGNQAGVVYDSRTYDVTVTVTDEDKDGQLEADIDGAYETERLDLDFVNSYEAGPGEVQFSGMKTLKGKTLGADEFSFTLTGEDDGVKETVKNAANGEINFSKISYNKVGEYRYTIKEDATTEKGIITDSKVYNLKVTVTDDGDGTLKTSISGDSRTGKNIDFTNKYSQSGTGVDSGDDARLLLMALIMMITAGGICAVLFLGRFRRKSEQND